MSFENDVIHKVLFLNKVNCFHCYRDYLDGAQALRLHCDGKGYVFINKVVTMK